MQKPLSKVHQQSIEWFDRDVSGMDEVEFWMKFPALLCSRSVSRHFRLHLLAMKVWNIIENRACAAIVYGFSKPQTRECIYTNTFTSKVSRG